jgi:hypothetical protein
MKLFQAVKAQQLVVRARCVAIACYGRLSVHAIAWSQVGAAGVDCDIRQRHCDIRALVGGTNIKVGADSRVNGGQTEVT